MTLNLKRLIKPLIKRKFLRLATTKLGLCFLISLGIGLIIGCSTDMEDLSKKNLTIRRLKIDEQDLDIKQTTKLKAKVEYNGDDRELLYNWTAEAGEIHNNGRYATYVAPEKAGAYTIKFEVCNGAITVSDAKVVRVGEPFPIKMSDDKTEPANANSD